MPHLEITSEGQHTLRIRALVDALVFFALPIAILVASGAERRIAYPILVVLCALYFYAREYLPRRAESASTMAMARWGTRTLAPRMALLALLLYLVFWLTRLNGALPLFQPAWMLEAVRWEHIALATAIGLWILEMARARALRKDIERLAQDRDRVVGRLIAEQKK